MFVLKKIISVCLMPLPFCLGLMTIGLVLVWQPKHLSLGRALLCTGVIGLLLFSNRYVSNALIRPLEAMYPAVPELRQPADLPVDLRDVRTVVVLGGGHRDRTGIAALSQLSSASRSRLTEGVRLMNALPKARLVVTGGRAENRVSHASVQAQAAIALGVAPARIIQLDQPRDTEEEAEAVHQLLAGEPFALVTSAWHLRRATALMRRLGLQPVPCACDFIARPPEFTWRDLMCDTESLGRSTWAVYERIGFLWAQARGKT